MRLKLPSFVKTRDKSYFQARIRGFSFASLLSIALGLMLGLSAIYSGVGMAKADSVIATIHVGRGPADIIFDSTNGNLYSVNSIDNTVSVISGQTNTIVGNPIHVENGPLGGAFDSANGNVYIANFNDNTVSVISGQTNTIVGVPIMVGAAPESIAFDSFNGNLYVTNRGDNTVSVISGQTNTVTDVIRNVGITPNAIAFDSANGNLYVTSFNDNTVSVISGQTNKVIGSPIPVGRTPLGITFDSANGNLYVTNGNDNTVSEISGETNSVIGSPMPAGPTPDDITFNSANGNLYLTNIPNSNVNTVSVISGQSNTLVGNPITVGTLPLGITFDSANNDIYVANAGDDTLSVISTVPLQAPSTTITSVVDGNGATIPNGGTTFSTAIKLTFTASAGTNPIAGFECSLDNGIFSSCLSPTTLTNLAVGSHTFQVRAIDTSGDRDMTPASFSWKIAAFYPPSHTIITSAVDGNGAGISNGGTTTSNSITFTLSAIAGTFPIAGFQCSIDNSQFSGCTSPAALHNLATGSHRFTAVAVDTVGNKDPTPASFAWTILTPAQGIEQLIQTINGMHLNPGTQTSLDAQLNGILTTLSLPIKNNLLYTCPHLDAFVNTAVPDYLHAGQLNTNQAAQIIQSAQNIQKALGCTGNGH